MRRSYFAVLLFAAVLLPGGTEPVTAQEVDRNSRIAGTPSTEESGIVGGDEFLTFYESPSFGYVVPWTEEWSIQSEDSGRGGDVLVLGRKDDIVTFHGYEGHAGDPDVCLNASIEQLEETSQADVHLAMDPEDYRMDNAEGFGAFAVFLMDSYSDAGGEHPESVWLLECRRLVAGSAVLAITYTVPRERYEDLMDSAYVLIDSVVMPRSSYDLAEVDGQPVLVGLVLYPELIAWVFPRPPGLLLGNSGEEVGMATVVAEHGLNSDRTSPWDLYVLFENTSMGDLRIDPLAVYVTAFSQTGDNEFQDETVGPSEFQWETGDGIRSDQGQVIGPGNRMLVRLTYEPFFGGTPPGINTYKAAYETEQIPIVTVGEWTDPQAGRGTPRLGG